MTANVGLAIQCVGVVLIALLSLSMRESIKSACVKYWTTAWICLSFSLLSLVAAFHISPEQKPFYAFYFFGEYAFGLMFIAGCRHFATGKVLTRADFIPLGAALAVAAILPFVSADFNDLFMMHATIVAAMFAVSFFYLRPAFKTHKSSPGFRVMCAALVLLALDFLHYVPVFGARKGLWGITVPASYLQYTSIFDLILEILLGFGTIMVSLEGVRREVEAANYKLTNARDQLELMARMDPLTEALNRHAFHSLLSRGEGDVQTDVDGSVAVIDVDNLKKINDTHGHSVGDRAIRAVARATRSLIRADDMLFRWGGDEFLVLMFKLDEQEARRRMQTLNEVLATRGDQTPSLPAVISVSVGVSGFESMNNLGRAIEQADQAMYQSRKSKRQLHSVREPESAVSE
ncbi:MAG TPA: GGDEF domain-containing protein [Pyrinomonadaceae bacterium]|nr:GGDEF domain-containing protein [Pyrinomonadaceae bacterium]